MAAQTITKHILKYTFDRLSEIRRDNLCISQFQNAPEELRKIVDGSRECCLVSRDRRNEIIEWIKQHCPELRVVESLITWDQDAVEGNGYRISLNVSDSNFRCFLCDNFVGKYKDCTHTNIYIIIGYVLCPVCNKEIRVSTNRFGVVVDGCSHTVEWTYGSGELNIFFGARNAGVSLLSPRGMVI